MKAWIAPMLAGMAMALAWSLGPLMRTLATLEQTESASFRAAARAALEYQLREVLVAFLFGFGVACAALAYRNTLAARRRP